MGKPGYEKIVPAVAGALGVAAVALFGFVLMDTQSAWYRALLKPAFAPPETASTVAWIVVYGMIAAALVLLLLREKGSGKNALLFMANGLLLLVWGYTFYILQSAVGAFAVLLVLTLAAWLLVRDTILKDALAGWLLAPYLIWLVYVLILHYVIAMIN
jgi:tryptophan-rich sensory protein